MNIRTKTERCGLAYDIRQRLIEQCRITDNISPEYMHSTEYSQSKCRKSNQCHELTGAKVPGPLHSGETSDPRPFGTSKSVRQFGTSAEVSVHIRTSAEVSVAEVSDTHCQSVALRIKEDTSAWGNTGPSHGKADFCACVKV